MKLLFLAMAALLATSTGASATVFDTVKNKMVDLFKNVKMIVFVVGGFGLVGLGAGAIFGAVKWKWFASLAIGLAAVAVAGAAIDWATGAGDPGMGDTLS